MEAIEQLENLQRRVRNGEEVSSDEYKMVLTNLRADRRTAAPKAKTTSKEKPSNLPENLNDMFNL